MSFLVLKRRQVKFFACLTTFLSFMASATDFTQMEKTASQFTNIKTVHIQHKGELIWAKAYNDADLNAVANIKSASKSLMSLIVGIAIEKGIIEGVDEPISTYFAQDFPTQPDSRLNDITVGHLLSMQAGLERTSGRHYGRWVISENWVQTALSRPFVSEPGGTMQYSTGSTHLLSVLIARATGQNTYRLANQWLKGSGIHIASWETDPQGYPMGGNQLGMTPKSLLALGELYRLGGKTQNAQQIVSADWIKQSWASRTQSRFHRGQYGYGWFMQPFGGVMGYYGWGYGGQMIYVLPELDLTVAITSKENLPSGRSGYRDELHTMLSQDIVPAITKWQSQIQ